MVRQTFHAESLDATMLKDEFTLTRRPDKRADIIRGLHTGKTSITRDGSVQLNCSCGNSVLAPTKEFVVSEWELICVE